MPRRHGECPGAGQPRQVIAMTDNIKRRVTADNYFAIVPEWVLYSDVSPTAKCCYAVLQRYANNDGLCFPSRKTIADKLAVSVRSIDRSLDELERINAVRIRRRMNPDGSFTSNLYEVLSVNPHAPNRGVATKTTLPSDKNDTRGSDKNDTLIKASINQSHLTRDIYSASEDAWNKFWAIYPRKKDKQAALKAWKKALKDGTDPQHIIDGATRYAEERSTEDPQYTKYPASWLNAGSWENQADQPAAPKATARTAQVDRVQTALERIGRTQQREITQ